MAMNFFWVLKERLRPMCLIPIKQDPLCFIGIKRSTLSVLNKQKEINGVLNDWALNGRNPLFNRGIKRDIQKCFRHC